MDGDRDRDGDEDRDGDGNEDGSSEVRDRKGGEIRMLLLFLWFLFFNFKDISVHFTFSLSFIFSPSY